MSKIVKFENSSVEVQKIEGVWMFELYSVGMALGQIKKNSKGMIYPRKDRIDENVKNAEIQPCVRNGHKYLTESQVYDLMLETRTDKCRAFRKWLTNEVLPELNRTGTYSVNKEESKQLEFYEYFDKTYNGNSVLTATDIEVLFKVSNSSVNAYAKKYLKKDSEYYLLTGAELVAWKNENPRVSKLSSTVTVITKGGFEKICRYFNLTIETPKLFIEDKSQTEPEKKKTEYCLIRNNNFAQEEIERIKNYLVAVSVAVYSCNKHNLKVDEMAVRRKNLEEITSELQSRVCVLAHMKLSTTTEYKF